jgi:prepilin-type N-terminal cleavage/methylation domain-containing protein
VGFTLIELLVVITIIGILLSVVLPSLSHARTRAQATQCLSQLRTLGQFTQMYADVSGDQMPRSQHSAFAAKCSPWGFAFFEFITDRAYTAGDADWSTVFNTNYRCPLDRRRDRWSYGYNVYFELTPDESAGRAYRKLTLIPRPVATVLFGELNETSSGDHAMAHFWTQFQAPPEIDAVRHKPGTGAAFADGHSETRAFDKLFSISTDRNCFDPEAAH